MNEKSSCCSNVRKIQRKAQENTYREEKHSMIIAVDFDGVLCVNKFPEIGKPNYEIISLVKQLIDQEHEVILWTSRVDNELVSAVRWCEDYGLKFCAVNDNAPSNKAKYLNKYPNGTRKVYADVYIDDHNLDCVVEANCGIRITWSIATTIKSLLKMEDNKNV